MRPQGIQIPFHPCFLQAPGPWKSPLPHLFSMTGRQSDQQFLCLFNILQAHPTSHLPTHPPTSTSTRTAFKRGGPGASAPSPRTKAPGGCSRPAQTWRRTDGGHTIADADKQGGHRGQGQGSGRRGAPTGSGPVLEAVGGPDGSPAGDQSGRRGTGSSLAAFAGQTPRKARKSLLDPRQQWQRPVGFPGRARH